MEEICRYTVPMCADKEESSDVCSTALLQTMQCEGGRDTDPWRQTSYHMRMHAQMYSVQPYNAAKESQ